jgi:hypothetical protein
MDAGILHEAVAEVCPIVGVRMGKLGNRATWSFEPAAEATPEQIAAADNVIATIDADTTPVPPVISDRQFFQQLAIDTEITEQEALDAVMTGVIPARLETALGTLPTAQQFSARMALSGSTEFRRAHPMTNLLQAALGWTKQQTDDLWRKASLI